jgi:hypothetical protein
MSVSIDFRLGEEVSHREGHLESQVPLDRLRHCKVVQLVREHDPPSSTEGASGLVVDEQLVVFIDVGRGVAIFPLLPVIRVILSHDRLQANRIGDRTNTILHPTNMSVSLEEVKTLTSAL